MDVIQRFAAKKELKEKLAGRIGKIKKSSIDKAALLGAIKKRLGGTMLGKGVKNMSMEMGRKKRLKKWVKANPGKEQLVAHMR